MNDKIVLITGGNAGIGKATATGLAKLGATVVIACRSKERGQAAVNEIRNKTGNANVDLLLMDLASQRSVRTAAEEFKNRYPQLHVLINNAGVFLPNRELTEDGIEKTFATNYLGHFLLTHLLLDRLRASAPSRIINVASKHSGIKINFDDLMHEKKYSIMGAVGPTKLGLVMFTKALAKYLEGSGVTAYSLHPGVAKTTLLKDAGIWKLFFKLMPRVSPEKAAETSIYLATAPGIEHLSGKFFSNKKEARTTSNANNEEAIDRLWNISMKLSQLA